MTRWALVGITLSLSLAACSTSSPCSASSCQFGCCTAQGTCLTSTSDTQCGLKGAQCQACGSGAFCQLGVCTPTGFVGGGGGATGGGTATGGGAGTGGAGGGVVGGGTGGGPVDLFSTCTHLSAALRDFQSGGACNVPPNLGPGCLTTLQQCPDSDTAAIARFADCLILVPACDPGRETVVMPQFDRCFDQSGLSVECRDRFLRGSPDAGAQCALPLALPSQPAGGQNGIIFIDDAGVKTMLLAYGPLPVPSNPAVFLLVEAFPDAGVFAGGPVFPGTWRRLPDGGVNGFGVGIQVMEQATGQTTAFYAMSEGTLTLTSVPQGVGDLFNGQVVDARFVQVELNDPLVATPNGCATYLPRFDFSAGIMSTELGP